MARQYDFGRNQILRPEFLNTLQKILQTYLDNFFLERSGNQVLAPATLDDPISFNVDRRMRRASTTLAAAVTGAPGARDVYIVVRPLQPDQLELLVLPDGAVPTDSSGRDVWRHIGEAEFDGATVTSVTTFPVRTGADMLAGRSSTYPPFRFGIPFANEDGRLHPDWFPEVASKKEGIGTIRRQYLFPGQALDLGTDWVVMNGQTLPPSAHNFPGGGFVTLPNPGNAITRGVTPGGLGAVQGDNSPRDLTHVHDVDAHTHTVDQHTHPVPAHQHQHLNHSHSDQPNPLPYKSGATDHTIQIGLPVGQGVAPMTSGPLEKSPNFGNPNINTSGASNLGTTATDEGVSGPPSVDMSQTDVRPAHVGLLYLIKVR